MNWDKGGLTWYFCLFLISCPKSSAKQDGLPEISVIISNSAMIRLCSSLRDGMDLKGYYYLWVWNTDEWTLPHAYHCYRLTRYSCECILHSGIWCIHLVWKTTRSEPVWSTKFQFINKSSHYVYLKTFKLFDS